MDILRELCKLYDGTHQHTKIKLNYLKKHGGWREYKTNNCFVLYKCCSRFHCGRVVIIDTIISTRKGAGTKAINWIKRVHPDHTIQLDCAVDNTAIEFYKKQGFKIRANSLVYKS